MMLLLVRQVRRQGKSVVLALPLELTAVPIFPRAFSAIHQRFCH
jgi:hypothetical protein